MAPEIIIEWSRMIVTVTRKQMADASPIEEMRYIVEREVLR